jgi:DNA replication protein DnaC
MNCEVIIYTNCPAGHPLKARCGAPPKSCSKCEADLKHAEKQRELAHKHDLRVAELDAQLQSERDVIRAAQLSEEREKALRQKEIDLRHAREAASNVNSQDPTEAPPPTLLGAAVSTLKGTVIPQKLQPTATTPSAPADPRSAKGRWEHQKRTAKAQNESIDAIMDMIGLEEVKDQVMSIKDKIDVATRQSTDLRKERFNIAMLGNPGTGQPKFSDRLVEIAEYLSR